MKQAVDGLQRELKPRIQTQARVSVTQGVDERHPSLSTKSDRSRHTQYNACRGRAAERPPVSRRQQREREENAKLVFIGQQTDKNARQPRLPPQKGEREVQIVAGKKPLLPSRMFSATTKGVTAAITAVRLGIIA